MHVNTFGGNFISCLFSNSLGVLFVGLFTCVLHFGRIPDRNTLDASRGTVAWGDLISLNSFPKVV